MRDIKFRVWDKDNKKMILDENILKICFLGKGHTPNMIVYSDKNINRYEEIDKRHCHNFDLMMYTGVNDCKNKEIYEGDIFAHNNQKFEVIYDGTRFIGVDGDRSGKGYCYYVDSCYKDGSSSIEVIGNVYENPRLMKEGNK